MPPEKQATSPKDNFPKISGNSIKFHRSYEETSQVASDDSAGLHIYFHSLDDKQYYGPLNYKAAKKCQLLYSDETSQPFELPSNCDHITMQWKNKPGNKAESGAIWGTISFYK